MNSQKHGDNILINNQVTNIDKHGFWILVNNIEYFVPFADYPVFMKATIEQIIDFQTFSTHQLYWKSLDCDIELEALEKPQQFPLLYK